MRVATTVEGISRVERHRVCPHVTVNYWDLKNRNGRNWLRHNVDLP